jgi:uncharacterized protein (UPF0332 family)
MPFDWGQYLELARSVRDQLPGEAAYRCAVSRAYYAAYWKAKKYLQQGDEHLYTGDRSHEVVWANLDNVQISKGVDLGEVGDRLKKRRNRADYMDRVVVSYQDACSAITIAEQIIQGVDDLIAKELAEKAKLREIHERHQSRRSY